MLTASQDIDNFIEGHRSKINNPSYRQEANHQPPPPPPPPPPPQSLPLNNSGEQSDVMTAQVLNELSPRVQTQPSTAPFSSSSFIEQHEEQNFQNDDPNKNYFGFFDRFGTHDQVRARLNNDLKREYNEYLQSLQNMAKSKVTSQMSTPRGNTTRRVQFQQNQIFTSPQQQQTDRKTIHNAHSMSDISSSKSIHNSTQSLNDLSSGRTMHNVQSMNDLSSTVTTDLAANRARARLVQHESEQYIRDREEYILELYEQIYELESRIRNLEKESRKLTLTNSTTATRTRYTEDLNALNALLAERLNQRVAVDHELTEILNRPPVSVNTRRVVVNGAPSTTISTRQVFESVTPRIEQTTKKHNQQDFEASMRDGTTKKITEHQQQYQSPRSQQNPLIPGRPASPNYARGSIYNGIFGSFKTEEQVQRQERYRLDLLQQIEEKRLRDAAELARRRAAEERERAKELERQRILERQMAEEALRKQEREEQERRQQQLLEEEAERQRRLEELERQRREEELERQRRQEEFERQRKEDELERIRRQEEFERLRKEEESERQKRLEESERKRKQDEAERKRQLNELDRQRRKEEEEERRRREELERQRREESALERQKRREEEEERRRREEEEESERKRRLEEEEEEERRRREEERRRNAKVVRSNSSLGFDSYGTDSEVLRRLLQLKRQLKDKENRLKDTITTETTHHTHIVDYTSPPYLPPPQPFYLERRESSNDLLDIARIHYRDAPLTHDILLNILHTADGDELHPGYARDDSVIMRGIAESKRYTSAEYLVLPARIENGDDLFATSIGNAASRRRYGASLPAFHDDDPLNTADKELNRIAVKNDHRLTRLRHIEQGDPSGLDHDELLERFQNKQRLERHGSQTGPHDNAWLK